MIRYNLHCDRGHAFESWFQSSSAYDSQLKRKLVSCPSCGSAKVEKAIMSPRLARKDKSTSITVTEDAAPSVPSEATAPVAMISPQEQELRTKLRELREHLVKNAENVGQQFPEDARKMHYGEKEHRSIYGTA